MDADRFDQITRSLAWNVSRRSMVKGFTTLLAGAAIAARPLSVKGAPNPCNAYCAGEPGSRGAQCRQACKDCGGPTSRGFCHDQLNRQYLCCPDGLECFEPFVDEGVHAAICCAVQTQVCQTTREDFYCCPDGEGCWGYGLCCPAGTQNICEGACCESASCCFSRDVDEYICGESCYDICQGQTDCGEANSDGSCGQTACLDPCENNYRCGPADAEGYCIVDRCFNVCTEETNCSPPNERGNCPAPGCFDPCNGVDICGNPDSYGNCYEMTCYDPEQETTVCGPMCWHYCASTNLCGTVTNNFGYCDGSYCFLANVGPSCGPADDDGNCID